MTIHREGKNWVWGTFITVLLINFLVLNFRAEHDWITVLVLIVTLVFFLLILQFFRYPKRNITRNENYVIAPADGKVVVIERTEESEYYKDKRIQVSIFMSPINVHANWYPMSGKIKFLRYHKGKYLVAWHPKASTENERSTIVVEKDSNKTILLRQIAGALAKRIVYYPRENDLVKQGAEMGFIKFGSRVDIYLPLTAKINVELNQKTKGGVTVIAELV
ncbi:MAG: phosphatidylserine decarboxylase family protein [Bacteroidetes bacterium]|jgi:phosphatidylserine decarboxylase|nr:phosphatidylserine decarboxylase family protein [Bacteroidota bacterium]MBX7238150.1 phosphatidylserine decarboxylase family protein [Bacteroidia bacterium]MCC7513822.1 phosphatidylserine decarboxylase family protein [Bacteroidia bacterium]MCW5919034.1 phosphatidylserine decarboxylase family protein [Bacteroidota bacterium]HMU77773.1 phosphatidylserine decarboxylase family protein [Bacteroidia bacterium]